MKMKLKHFALIVLGMGLSSCASQTPKPAPAEIAQTPLTVRVKPNIAANTGLRVVDRAATAKMVGLKTLAGVLGAFGGRADQQVQERAAQRPGSSGVARSQSVATTQRPTNPIA